MTPGGSVEEALDCRPSSGSGGGITFGNSIADRFNGLAGAAAPLVVDGTTTLAVAKRFLGGFEIGHSLVSRLWGKRVEKASVKCSLD